MSGAKAKATTKRGAARERIPRYVDEYGQYFAIQADPSGVFKIGWYLPGEECFGLMCSNGDLPAYGQMEEDGYTNAANDICIEYCKEKNVPLPGHGIEIEFDTRRQAQECLRRINAELHYRKQNMPLPDWAKTALAAGWLPPKGWAP